MDQEKRSSKELKGCGEFADGRRSCRRPARKDQGWEPWGGSPALPSCHSCTDAWFTHSGLPFVIYPFLYHSESITKTFQTCQFRFEAPFARVLSRTECKLHTCNPNTGETEAGESSWTVQWDSSTLKEKKGGGSRFNFDFKEQSTDNRSSLAPKILRMEKNLQKRQRTAHSKVSEKSIPLTVSDIFLALYTGSGFCFLCWMCRPKLQLSFFSLKPSWLMW